MTITGELTGEELYKLKRSGKKRREIAEFTGLSMGTVGGRIWRYEQTLKGAPQERAHLFSVHLGAPLALEGDALIVSDIQAPTTDLDMARLVVPVAQYHDIRRLIMNGDSLNVDWLSGYPVLVDQPRARQEIDSTAYLIEEWLRWFDEVIFLPGNHEDRFLKANAGNLEMRNLLCLLTSDKRVQTSNFDHLSLETSSGKWFVCHGKSYSVNQLVVADVMAQKYQANIVMGHQHHLALGWDRFKRYMVVDNGGLFAPEHMAYVAMRANKMPNMQKGFMVLKDGFPSLYGPEPLTNWDALFDALNDAPLLALAA